MNFNVLTKGEELPKEWVFDQQTGARGGRCRRRQQVTSIKEFERQISSNQQEEKIKKEGGLPRGGRLDEKKKHNPTNVKKRRYIKESKISVSKKKIKRVERVLTRTRPHLYKTEGGKRNGDQNCKGKPKGKLTIKI